jgi:two-component system response regulator DctR
MILKAWRFGAVDYIIKPFSEKRLLASLESYKSLLNKLKNIDSFNQEELDKMRQYVNSFNPERQEYPKGIHESSINKIVRFLSGKKAEVDVYEIAEGIRMSAVTARRYLNYLRVNNVVKMDVKYSDIGRPRHVYKLRDSQKKKIWQRY